MLVKDGIDLAVRFDVVLGASSSARHNVNGVLWMLVQRVKDTE